MSNHAIFRSCFNVMEEKKSSSGWKVIWHDPVWSKVIAQSILAVAAIGIYYARDRFQVLDEVTPVKNYLIVVVLMVIAAAIFGFGYALLKSIRNKWGHEKSDVSPEIAKTTSLERETSSTRVSTFSLDDAWKHCTDLGSQQTFMFRALFNSDDFSFLSVDSRFDRLQTRLKKENFDRWLGFMKRLLIRAEQAYDKNEPNPDVMAMRDVLNAETDEKADTILKKIGLI